MVTPIKLARRIEPIKPIRAIFRWEMPLRIAIIPTPLSKSRKTIDSLIKEIVPLLVSLFSF